MVSGLGLSGRVALVTGAGIGIGRSAALALSKAGAQVAVHCFRSREQAQEVVELISADGGSAFLIQADLTQPSEAQRTIEEVRREAGRLDILVNNAGGINRRVPMEEVTPELLREMLDVNLLSALLVTQASLPLLRQSDGAAIINITSIAAYTGAPGACHYGAAKAALGAMTRGWAKELAPDGIRVNAVAPGVIETRFHERVSSPERMQAFREATPLGRNGHPDEVAGAIVMLASNWGSFVTGETIHVNGGLLMV
ncbi:MAG: 3-oxoacyl-ACP reductase FabG [Anaerolineae bacterium]|nr:3-oxoacyl-ACP reductase FabG [Anaerolineae bacterium]